MKHEKSDQHGKRNGKEYCCGSANASEEQPDHYGSQDYTNPTLTHHGRYGALHEERLIENNMALQL